jgi:hypothetical protein
VHSNRCRHYNSTVPISILHHNLATATGEWKRLTLLLRRRERERQWKMTANDFRKWEAPNTNKVAGTRHGYGFFGGRNSHTLTRTREKTRTKPTGIPLPLLYTRDEKYLCRDGLSTREEGSTRISNLTSQFVKLVCFSTFECAVKRLRANSRLTQLRIAPLTTTTTTTASPLPSHGPL